MEKTATDSAKEEKGRRRFMRYIFFKAARDWRSLGDEAKTKGEAEFLDVLKRYSPRLEMKQYSLVGIRGDVDFMIWVVAEDLRPVQEMVSELLTTGLGKHLDVPYSYLAMTKKSRYLGEHSHPGQEGEAPPRDSAYLFVYPLVKKREWYSLPFVERQRIMADHFRVGHKYPSIKINTGYSFGLDDQEFVVAFEGDDPADFLDLVEELRSSESSRYTERETPIFTCAAVDADAMLKFIR